MTARRCLARAKPKGNRKKGRCLKWARPSHAKKSAVPKTLKGVNKQLRKKAKKDPSCLKYSKAGKCLKRVKKVSKK